MSKSLGNFFTVRDLLFSGVPGDKMGVPGEVIRLVFLQTHYRRPMDWTAEKTRQALKTLDWLYSIVGEIPFDGDLLPNKKVVDALSDDLNTSLALTEFIQQARNIRPEGQRSAENDSQVAVVAELKRTAGLLGLLSMTEIAWWANSRAANDLSLYAARLSHLRTQAKETKDFTKFDALRSALIKGGVEVRISKDLVELLPGPEMDIAALEALK